ncbi:hypothetical protein ELS19_14055 [Halogeometricum borinquense]|uniref:DUF5658 domain-containing protein n=3 Tax=Halogeometricum borinquense TaxID=60847 RepID=E4NQZ3_HALBP|nr:hypothetical protein Hbor_00060 [Halogeometricum borinquense DSM 11551]RYJ14963.1 hypothetical protein ELS19_14055 [Halogeometricum borinquense]
MMPGLASFISFPSAVPMLDAVLWVIAVIFYGIGDYVTTIAATSRPGARERNPFVRRLFDGIPVPPSMTFAAAKVTAFAFFVVGYATIGSSLLRPLIPGVVAAIGILVTIQNIRVLGVKS